MMVFTVRYSMVLNIPCFWCPETWFYHSTYEETLLILFCWYTHYIPFFLLWLHFYTTLEILLMLLLSHSCETTLTKGAFPWSTKHHNFSHLALPRILGRWQRPQGWRTGWHGGRVHTSVAWVRWSERRSMRVATPRSQRTNCTANPRGRREGAWRCQNVSSNCTRVSSHWTWPTDKLNICRLQSEQILRIKTSDETSWDVMTHESRLILIKICIRLPEWHPSGRPLQFLCLFLSLPLSFCLLWWGGLAKEQNLLRVWTGPWENALLINTTQDLEYITHTYKQFVRTFIILNKY